MHDPNKPSDDVILLGKLPADDFEASVSKAREAARARIGLPADAPRPRFDTVLAQPRPVATSAAPSTAPGPTAAQAHAHPHVSGAPTAPVMHSAMAPRSTAATAPHLTAVPSPHAAPTAMATPSAPSPTAASHGHTPAIAAAAPLVASAAPVPHVASASHGGPRVVLTADHANPVPTPTASPSTPMPAPAVARPRGFRVSLPLVGVGLLVLAGAAGALLYFEVGGLSLAASPTVAAPTTGTVHIVSRPAGATVIVNGTPRGTAPINLTLSPGSHSLELHSGATKRVLPLAVEAGTIVRQYVDFGTPVQATGTIEITSEPAGAQVLVDGTPRGTTPLVVTDVAPGSHIVAVGAGTAAVTRTVDVRAGATAAVVVSIAPTEGAAGWVAVKAPFPLEMRQGERMLAAAGVDRVMLPTGRHQLELVARDYEFFTTITVNVQAGKTVSPTITIPNGKLSINAAPWAEVWLDGKDMGTTPLGNLSVPIGTHEIVWKHPQFGERRQTIKVLAETPVRASIEFGK